MWRFFLRWFRENQSPPPNCSEPLRLRGPPPFPDSVTLLSDATPPVKRNRDSRSDELSHSGEAERRRGGETEAVEVVVAVGSDATTHGLKIVQNAADNCAMEMYQHRPESFVRTGCTSLTP